MEIQLNIVYESVLRTINSLTMGGQTKSTNCNESRTERQRNHCELLRSIKNQYELHVVTSKAEATSQRKEENEDFTELMAQDSAARELLGFAKKRLNKEFNFKSIVAQFSSNSFWRCSSDVMISLGLSW